MTIMERLRTVASLQEDEETSFLLNHAADLLEAQHMWKLKWAELDHAYSELYKRYQELQKNFDDYRKEVQR